MEKPGRRIFSETLIMRLLFYTIIITCCGVVFFVHARSAVLPANAQVDSIVVIKHDRIMYVFQQQQLLKEYKIALGRQPVGHKHFKGDMCTPEGIYFINGKNPKSTCHKSWVFLTLLQTTESMPKV